MAVVCGIDFSPRSDEAASAAAQLAARFQVPLVLVHAVYAYGMPLRRIGDEEVVYDDVRRRLRAEAERLRETVAAVHAELLMGNPDEALLEAAERHSARLVVVASLGHRAAGHWLLGSVAERTASTSPVPTLVVRANEPLLAWARGERPLRILVGADFTAASDAALSWVSELAKAGPCEVTVAHVAWPPGERLRLGTTRQQDLEHVLERDLAKKVGDVLGQVSADLRVQLGSGITSEELVRLADEVQADLVVVGAHQRSGLSALWRGSVSRDVLTFASTNVVCVPMSAVQQARRIPRLQAVLVTTDLSPIGDAAIPQAYAMLPRGGMVYLMHVIEPVHAPNPLYAHYQPGRAPTAEERARQIEDIKRRLLELVPEDAADRGIRTQVHVVESHEVGQTIASAAERLGVDCICMASHGRSGLAKLALGSVAQDLLRRTGRPVQILRPARQ